MVRFSYLKSNEKDTRGPLWVTQTKTSITTNMYNQCYDKINHCILFDNKKRNVWFTFYLGHIFIGLRANNESKKELYTSN